MLLEDLFEQKKVVIFGGRFQPFHDRHFEIYKNLIEEFGKEHVYIATSNKTEKSSPFTFQEKQFIINELYGIPRQQIVNTKTPYIPSEILENYNENQDAMIQVIGIKDGNRLKGKYYSDIYSPNKFLAPFAETGYIYIMPLTATNISATDIRVFFRNHNKEENKEYFNKIYKKNDIDVFKLYQNKLNGAKQF